ARCPAGLPSRGAPSSLASSKTVDYLDLSEGAPMSRARAWFGFVAAVVMAMSVLIAAQERDRSKVADKYTWNLADVYPDVAAWRAEKDAIKAELPGVRAFAG